MRTRESDSGAQHGLVLPTGALCNARPHCTPERALIACAILAALAVAHGQKVYVHLPDSLTARVGDSVQVPVLISGQTGQGTISADISLVFRQAVLTGSGSYRVGNAVPSGWMVDVNPLFDTLLIAMAGVNPLVAGDTLLVVKMKVAAADTTLIAFARCQLNEGNVACSTRAGKFRGRIGGIEEKAKIDRRGPDQLATIVQGVLWLAADRRPETEDRSSVSRHPSSLLDIAGCKVLDLHLGANDVSGLAPGVYFVGEELPALSFKPLAMRKVILTR